MITDSLPRPGTPYEISPGGVQMTLRAVWKLHRGELVNDLDRAGTTVTKVTYLLGDLVTFYVVIELGSMAQNTSCSVCKPGEHLQERSDLCHCQSNTYILHHYTRRLFENYAV